MNTGASKICAAALTVFLFLLVTNIRDARAADAETLQLDADGYLCIAEKFFKRSFRAADCSRD